MVKRENIFIKTYLRISFDHMVSDSLILPPHDAIENWKPMEPDIAEE